MVHTGDGHENVFIDRWNSLAVIGSNVLFITVIGTVANQLAALCKLIDFI